MTRRLAIIPARGGSKRIPNKNIRDFCGRPMIMHILETARSTKLFSTIHVSTENDRIRDIVARFGFSPDFLRPKELADDQTPIMPVLKYAALEYQKRGSEFDEIWLLMACAPLVQPCDLLRASEKFSNLASKRPLIGVREYPAPIEWAFVMGKGGSLTPLQPGKFSCRSQDLAKRYFDAGCFAIFPADVVLSSQGAGSDNGFVGYPLEKNSAIDIDDEEDWSLAEALYKSRQVI